MKKLKNVKLEPQIIKKYETVCTKLDKKILLEIKIKTTQNYLVALKFTNKAMEIIFKYYFHRSNIIKLLSGN